ncbi:hypothetical protein [Albirhodobacter sp. R86504]|uniref:hypothetical protein n=1 Tax=Albirhodobacter sp. R86504 TaxID=3093848 RepID=UPI00366AD8EC
MINQTTLDIVEVLRFGTPSEKRGCLIGMGLGELARTYGAAVVASEDAARRWRDCPRRAMTDAEFAEDMLSEGMAYVDDEQGRALFTKMNAAAATIKSLNERLVSISNEMIADVSDARNG